MTAPQALPDISGHVSPIADLLESAAPETYDSLVAEADFEETDATGVDTYALTGSTKSPVSGVGFDIIDVFEQIYQAFVDASQPPWTGATVTVTADGDTRVDFAYLG